MGRYIHWKESNVMKVGMPYQLARSPLNGNETLAIG